MLRLEFMLGLEEWKDAKELTSAGAVLLVFPCLEELIIRGCHKLRDLPDSLCTCVSLQKFVVENCLELRSLPGVPSVIRHLEIIESGIDELPSGLQFCASLQYLEIRSCWNLKSIPESLHSCVSLQKFVVRDCRKLRYLLGVPSVIRHLEIIGCGIDELPSRLQFCASLQYLEIRSCWNLKSIPESLHSCVSLQKFVVRDCCKLSFLPGVLSVIRHLEIIGCGIDELPSGLQFCASLQYLKIEDCQNLKSIPDLGELFHSLINLKLSSSSYQRLTLLQEAKHLREGCLKTLVIGGFIEELDAFPILLCPSIQNSHASLKKLILRGSCTLNSLPDKIRLFTALEELRIQKFNRMEALPDWFSYPSLQKLSLRRCKKLMSLPIPHLTNLKHLHIDYCRNLEERYAEESSVEWSEIAHVPNIRIDGEYIQEGEDSDDFEDFEDSEDDYVSEDEVDDSEGEVEDSEDEVDDSEDEVEDGVEDSHYNLQEDSILENNQCPTDWEGINRFLFESDSS